MRNFMLQSLQLNQSLVKMPSVVFACQTQELGVKITFINYDIPHSHAY